MSVSSPERPEIAMSWHRSILSGVATAGPRLANPDIDIDPTSRLLRAAVPVLDQLAERLIDTRYNLILADRQGRIVYRWFADRRLEAVLDDLGIRPGATGAEEVIGTNAIGTTLEIRRGIAINGEEHYIEPFKPYSCYGHPIISPVSRRIEGVLDISCTTGDANPLLAPFLVRAVEDIQLRLVDLAGTSERLLMRAFQAESTLRNRALAAFGDDVVLTNKAAVDLLSPGDYASMRLLAAELDCSSDRHTRVRLSSGLEVDVHLTRIDDTTDGTLFRFNRTETPPQSVTSQAHATDSAAIQMGPVLIHGTAGTGRTTEARRLRPGALFLDSADAVTFGERAWASRLQEILASDATVGLENIDLLPCSLIPLVVDVVSAGHAIVLTSCPVRDLQGPHLALASMVVEQRELIDLQDRTGEIESLAMHLVKDIEPQADIRLLPSVIEALATRAWPGNLHELRAVMVDVLKRRNSGDVTVRDLPQAYRTTTRTRNLAGRERAERIAIIEALKVHDGNKARAAKDLGISRTTLYARMRALKIGI